MSLCEIRVPTYKRPDLLKRALVSLVEQTHTNWKAIVLDDSPEQEGKRIVKDLKDDRIIYRPNTRNLGRAKNLDYAFSSKSYIDGLYACVLEDDNYLLPDFLTENIKSIETNGVNIILRNQEIRLEKNGTSLTTTRTTRGRWFNQGIYNPLEIYARLFFCEGISNGGLFWHTDRIQSNLQVGSQIDNSWHQEVFRTLQIKEPIYFDSIPLSVFTEFVTEENFENFFARQYKIFIEKKQDNSSTQTLLSYIQDNRSTQAILCYLINSYGNQIVQEAQKVALEKDAESILERQLINTLYFNYPFKKLSNLDIVIYTIKYSLRRIFFKNNFQIFLNKKFSVFNPK